MLNQPDFSLERHDLYPVHLCEGITRTNPRPVSPIAVAQADPPSWCPRSLNEGWLFSPAIRHRQGVGSKWQEWVDSVEKLRSRLISTFERLFCAGPALVSH